MRTTPFLGCLAVVLLAPASALGQDRTWEWQWGMHPMVFMWGAGGLVMMLMMLVFWGLIIAGLVLGVRWLAAQGRGDGRDEALEILCQRYARGRHRQAGVRDAQARFSP
jgi:putative membrane protein